MFGLGTACIHLLSIILEKVVKRSFKYVTRPVVLLATKVIAIICSLRFGTNAVTPISHTEQILPCLERIEKLEKMVEELKTKPARIPEEKEQMLEHSMERIKSVELDLDKTKKVGCFLHPYKLKLAKWVGWVMGHLLWVGLT